MRRWRNFTVVVVMLAAQSLFLFAHEVRPAYLELRQTAANTYAVLWKVPAVGDMQLSIHPRFPENCKPAGDVASYRASDSFTERFSLACPSDLKGGTITIDGLAATMTDVLVRIERMDGSTQVARLTQSVPALVVDVFPSRLQVARVYSVLGVEHILTGVDHLLFVLALIIITRGGWKLVKTVTAFTLSHSVTLTAATLGLVHVPQRPVETVIALSIVFVAAEILRMRRGITSITVSAPWMVAFSFGLIHGLGFAGGLSDAGLPATHIPTALLFFSLGVESGHFLFIGVVLSSIALVARVCIPFPRWTELVPPYAIGTIAMFWVIQRTVLIFGF
jgi:hydrogenase/urease accessory protein HupE